jgi:hypothetical protein
LLGEDLAINPMAGGICMTTRKTSCVVLILGAMSLGGSGLAWAQVGEQPSEGTTPQDQSQFLRDKAALQQQAHSSVSAASANINTLKTMSKAESGDLKKQHEDLANNLSMLKDHVNKGIDKMNTVSMNDWSALRPDVERDVSALNAQLKNAAPITHIPLPAGVSP